MNKANAEKFQSMSPASQKDFIDNQISNLIINKNGKDIKPEEIEIWLDQTIKKSKTVTPPSSTAIPNPYVQQIAEPTRQLASSFSTEAMRLDRLINDTNRLIDEMTNPTKSSEASPLSSEEKPQPKPEESAQGKPATIDDLKKQLEQAREKLVAAQKRLGEAMKSLKAAKDGLPKAEHASIAAKEKLDKEMKRLSDEVKKVDEKMKELAGLANKTTNKEVKGIIEAQMKEGERQMKALREKREALGLNVVGADAGKKQAKDGIQTAQAKVTQAQHGVGSAKGEIAKAQKDLAQYHVQKKGGVDYSIPMFQSPKNKTV